MQHPTSLLTLAVLASLASAQQVSVPGLQAFANTGISTAVFRTTAGRFQAAYDSTLFTGAGVTGPITINRLRFRLADSRRNPGGQNYALATVEVGNCAVDHAALTTTFATNRGVMGPLGVIPVMTIGAADGTSPNSNVVDIDLAALGASVVYDPTTGTDFLIDITMPTDPDPAVPAGNGAGVTSAVSTTTVTTAAGHTVTPFAFGMRIRFFSGLNFGLSRAVTAVSAGVDITHAAFPVGALPGDVFVVERLDMEGFACGHFTATQKGKRLSSAIPLLPTGTLSEFAPACLIDFTGPGGWPSALGARTESYGAGCSAAAASFYQTFPLYQDFDLRGSPSKSLLLVPDNVAAPNLYIVTAGTTAPDLSPAALGGGLPNTADDGVVSHVPGFTFTFPGGSTTTFDACVNGYVWLGVNALGDFSPTVAEFLGTPATNIARVAPCWHDWHAGKNTTSHPGSGMYVNTDLSGGPGNGVTYVTWKEVGEFNTLTLPQGISVNTLQCAIFENGNVEFRYGSMSGDRFGSTITGFSRGNVAAVAAVDPGSRDLSVEVPFVTSAEGTVAYLGHGVTARPVLGTSVSFTGFNHPPGTVLSSLVISLGAVQPGFSFPPLGPSCIVSIDLFTASTWQLFFGPAGTVTSTPLALPAATAPGWMGFSVTTQYATLDGAGIAATSNAIKHSLGLQ